MTRDVEHWDVGDDAEIRMSDRGLGNLLRGLIRCGGRVTDSYVVGLAELETKGKGWGTADVQLRIVLPAGARERFERVTGLRCRRPPKIGVMPCWERGVWDDYGEPLFQGAGI